MKIFQVRKNGISYDSNPTRHLSLDNLMGGAQFREINEACPLNPGEMKEDLEARFNSGVNRTDCPRMWGHPSVDRKLGPKRSFLSEEIASWRRQNGEPLYRK